MTCETASELLPELLSGSLDRVAEAETLAHLARCEDCRRDLAFWAQMAETVQADAAALSDEAVETVRIRLFGERTATLGESLRIVGRALGLAGSACRLALSAAGN